MQSAMDRERQDRRRKLMTSMRPNSIALIAAAPVHLRNHDAEYPYRQDSDFYYLTGCAEAQALLVLIPGRQAGETVLFCQPKNQEKELWTGVLLGPEAAREQLGMDEAFAVDDLDELMPQLLADRSTVYYAMGKHQQLDQQVMGWVKRIRTMSSTGVRPPTEFQLLDTLLHEMRLIKSVAEIKLMEQAAQISAQAHRRAMKICRPGIKEYVMEAELLHEFVRCGSRAPAYNSIVATGANTCILHYNTNNAEVEAGELVLIDAGCEYQYYAADITRTFPANGSFNAEQRAIYELVLAAQQAAIAAVKPGAAWDEPHRVSVKVITRGLVKLGLLQGRPAQLIKSGAYKAFYMHRVGHWLGMDVHDVGSYRTGDDWRPLQAGMVTTIEPGIYIAPDNTRVPKQWRGIGVRIEDDVLVTPTGHRILSHGIPKTVAEIENFMAAG